MVYELFHTAKSQTELNTREIEQVLKIAILMLITFFFVSQTRSFNRNISQYQQRANNSNTSAL